MAGSGGVSTFRRPWVAPLRDANKRERQLLGEDGWRKVRRGITTIEEVLKCTAV